VLEYDDQPLAAPSAMQQNYPRSPGCFAYSDVPDIQMVVEYS
jgi:hypothetical protein